MARTVRMLALLGIVLIPFTLSCLVRSEDPARVQERANQEPVSVDPNDPVVHIGAFGNTYHTGQCSLLKMHKYPIALSEAQRFYKPCTRCKPPR